MTYAQSVALARSTAFADRVRAAVVFAALQIQGEARDARIIYYAKRTGLAIGALNDPEGRLIDPFVWAVSVNPVIASAGESAPDGDIDFVVSSVWDDIAGVTPEDETEPSA